MTKNNTESKQDKKLELEIKKLEAETKNLGRTFLFQPTFWISIIALVVSGSANIIQYSSAERNRELAEIKFERLSHETTLLEEKFIQNTERLKLVINTSEKFKKQISTRKQQLEKLKLSIVSGEATKEAIADAVDSLFIKVASDEDALGKFIIAAGIKFILENPVKKDSETLSPED